MQPSDLAAGKPTSYSGSGVVQQVISNEHLITIHHKEIPGYMPEMTMDFKVKDPDELNGVVPGSDITFNLLVLEDDAWVENVQVIGFHPEIVAGNAAATHDPSSELKQGESWPDEELTAEDGHRIHFSDFKGRCLAFTFFFTRCPLPDFCPRMNRKFAEACSLLSPGSSEWINSGDRTNFCFLSISFDPDIDTPERLASYAREYRQSETNLWMFAVASSKVLADLAPRVGLMVSRQGVGISHNLRTVVLDPEGRVYRRLDGNRWTPQELTSAMKDALNSENTPQPAPTTDKPMFSDDSGPLSMLRAVPQLK
jgi:protein SCO1/2